MATKSLHNLRLDAWLPFRDEQAIENLAGVQVITLCVEICYQDGSHAPAVAALEQGVHRQIVRGGTVVVTNHMVERIVDETKTNNGVDLTAVDILWVKSTWKPFS